MTPIGEGPNGEPLYAIGDALDALGESPVAAGRTNGRRISSYNSSCVSISITERRLYARSGPMTPLATRVRAMFCWDWGDLAELLG